MKPAHRHRRHGMPLPRRPLPGELWENVLAGGGRSAALPPERLRLEDYLPGRPSDPGRDLLDRGGGDRGLGVRPRAVPRGRAAPTASADLAHWLALDVAARRPGRRRLPGGAGLPRETTGVLVGNTLTGEFSRANSSAPALAVRAPGGRAELADAAAWTRPSASSSCAALEAHVQGTVPPSRTRRRWPAACRTPSPGGSATTSTSKAAATRWTAPAPPRCSPSPTPARRSRRGDLDVALAGGVDLSLDPFELVGFAKAGALARRGDARLRRALARLLARRGLRLRGADARGGRGVAGACRVYAVIRGWGISSDGSGGITPAGGRGADAGARARLPRAPASAPRRSATSRATAPAPLSATRPSCGAVAQPASRGLRRPPAAIGSIKANIGHTKAAAGVAGLIKAALALHHQVLPPTTGCDEPHPELAGQDARACGCSREGERLAGRPAAARRRQRHGLRRHQHPRRARGRAGRAGAALGDAQRLLGPRQDAELFLFWPHRSCGAGRQVERLSSHAARLSRAEMMRRGGNAGRLARGRHASRRDRRLEAGRAGAAPLDAGVVARAKGSWQRIDEESGVFLGVERAGRVGVPVLGPGLAGAAERRGAGAPLRGGTRLVRPRRALGNRRHRGDGRRTARDRRGVPRRARAHSRRSVSRRTSRSAIAWARSPRFTGRARSKAQRFSMSPACAGAR